MVRFPIAKNIYIIQFGEFNTPTRHLFFTKKEGLKELIGLKKKYPNIKFRLVKLRNKKRKK